MTQEDKELLIKDLSARLPYGVKAYVKNWSNFKTYEDVYVVKSTFPSLNEVHVQSKTGSLDVLIGYYDYEFKPYLFPLSSMTEEQYDKFIIVSGWDGDYEDIKRGKLSCVGYIGIDYIYDTIDWLNAHHFDYRGLIEKGLAIDATGLGIY